MASSQIDRNYPEWLRNTCCLAALGSLFVLCVSSAFGVTVEPYAFIAPGYLSAKVTTTMLGLPQTTLALKLPFGFKEKVMKKKDA